MPFALIIVGLALLVSGVRGTNGELFSLVKGEFSGDGNFAHWIVAILIVGSLGYISSLQKLSRAFLALIIVALFVKRGNGIFDKFNQQIFGK